MTQVVLDVDVLDKIKKTVEEEKAEAELSDESWLNARCADVRSRLADTKAYDTSAILYRKMRDAIGVFRQLVGRDIRNARLNKAGDPLTYAAYTLAAVNHPSQWPICGACDGSGADASSPDNPPCDACRGAGFKLSFGSTAK